MAGPDVNPRAAGLVLGYLADQAFGDPRRGHPVSGFGRIARTTERALYADHRAAGTLFTAVLVGGAAGLGYGVDRLTRRRPLVRTAVTAAATWTVLGGRSLAREATTIDCQLRRADLPAARRQVTHLVGRDPSRLDAAGVARATLESLAENTSDAVVAPLLWGAVAGPAGLLGYRAANTLDARVGHRTPRHEQFGWASARFDDLLNLAPARLSALLAAGLGERPGAALTAWRRDAHRHPSPNAGPVEAAFAGALGVTLGGVNVYHGVVEDRGTLGDGPAPEPGDIARGVRLAARVGAGALAVSAVVASASTVVARIT
ncbi:Cobalamin biosynthesis protein cbiB [Rhodococcus rhodochrous ATCC 21198]|uniref:cobalamin biosynthesis protein n=2 Tax=Rhodococcus TaxID=1827 RepID=UPI0003E226A4|nr:cobalamin biosynthesis protein [Rhodococcus aetherivorans]ETT24004.1 Cobalamin biosynthesis protein cbiB [Rhodococcus rhodochrous ATCC 21198]MBC2588954.1 cobalamin biosynthesis protein [Rhodococcus aetherivorans]NGP27905.1 cobalamin biosynthesis protein [Rhodococcus aetherivorans]WKW97524.1 cobalamin biosynthesis protein [Rhodococcus aetherivorans]